MYVATQEDTFTHVHKDATALISHYLNVLVGTLAIHAGTGLSNVQLVALQVSSIVYYFLPGLSIYDIILQ